MPLTSSDARRVTFLTSKCCRVISEDGVTVDEDFRIRNVNSA